MKRWISLLLALLFCLPLSGCTGEKTVTLRYDLPSMPRNLDPQTATSTADLTVIYQLFEGLLRLDDTGKPVPAAAEEMTVSSDGCTYTFRLRENLLWDAYDREGKSAPYPVTAQDFVFAFRRLLRPSTKSAGASAYFLIENAREVYEGEKPEETLGVTAPDARTLQIRLIAPNDFFPELLTRSYAMPCSAAFFEQTRGRYGLEQSTTMGNGPFSLKRWKADTSLLLERNAQYDAQDRTLPDALLFSISGEEEDALARLEEEYTDAAMLSAKAAESLDAKKYRRTAVCNTVCGILLHQSCPELCNENVRRAIAMVLDRESYAASLPAGMAVTDQILPPGILLHGANYREAVGEVSAALPGGGSAYDVLREGLAELHTDGINGLHLLLSADDETAMQSFSSISQILQRELSLFISVDALPEEEYRSALRAGQFDLAIVSLTAAENTPLGILSAFVGESAADLSGYHDAEYDRLLAEASTASRLEDAAEKYRAAEEYLASANVFLPLYTQTKYFVTPAKAMGWIYQQQLGIVLPGTAAEE